jgi:hypothetical protein
MSGFATFFFIIRFGDFKVDLFILSKKKVDLFMLTVHCGIFFLKGRFKIILIKIGIGYVQYKVQTYQNDLWKFIFSLTVHYGNLIGLMK